MNIVLLFRIYTNFIAIQKDIPVRAKLSIPKVGVNITAIRNDKRSAHK